MRNTKIFGLCLCAVLFLLGTNACASGGSEEEEGTIYSLSETHDEVRRGMRLNIAYNSEETAFIGTVTNTTDTTIGCVRVEIHVVGGPELGPTERIDLAAGSSLPVRLDASSAGNFDGWSAHPESGCGGGEHGGESGKSEGESGGRESREGESESREHDG